MKESTERRITKGSRGHTITFEVDGLSCRAYQGETIAAALIASGKRTFRLSPQRKEPRGLFCGMGVCFECAVTVNGVPNTRACMTVVEEGMKVETGVPEIEQVKRRTEDQMSEKGEAR